MKNLEELIEKQKVLMDHIPHGHVIKEEQQGLVVAALGVIEETLEYLNAIGFKSWRPNPLPRNKQLEEATDILFFYLEIIVLGGFSWPEIEEEYVRKWEENMERYRKAMKGDFSWDHRSEGGL